MPCFRGECVITPLSSDTALYLDPCFLETGDNVQCPVSPESSQYNVKSVSSDQAGSSIWILVFSLTVRIRQNIHLHRDQIPRRLATQENSFNNVLKLLLTRELVVYGSLSNTPYNHNLRVWDVRELRKPSPVSPQQFSIYHQCLAGPCCSVVLL